MCLCLCVCLFVHLCVCLFVFVCVVCVCVACVCVLCVVCCVCVLCVCQLVICYMQSMDLHNRWIVLPPSLPVYINHRPVFGLSPVDLVRAFQTLGSLDEAQGWTVRREELIALLQENGENTCLCPFLM